MQPVGGAVIAAAGLGSRLGHGLPKCLVEVEGVPILTRLIDALRNYTERIHVVVGYREELVTDYCATHHRDIVVVRNPDYRSTNTAYSYLLGSNGLVGRVLFLDGDLLMQAGALENLFRLGTQQETVVGITRLKSDDGVRVGLVGGANGPMVTEFSRSGEAGFEWANVLLAPPRILSEPTGFVFESLIPYLPLPAAVLELEEVDTESDLVRATEFVRSWV